MGIGGYAHLNDVTRKFGTVANDGYYWHDHEPESVTGMLRSMGLLVAGSTVIDKRNAKVAVFPAELRSTFEETLLK
ncbi:MAG TPA: hypothetical protein VLH18_03250 [Candidatus Limnocylindrales bacterium]|nr:hypothetical protein [Candidatus Limnocylindrales bacterium]